jgi:MFS family permease
MMITILIYSLCTGLSALSKGFWDFAFYRFITGLGVGGEFAVGVALIAESVPAVARPHALALLQALSAVGNITAALISILLGHLEAELRTLVEEPDSGAHHLFQFFVHKLLSVDRQKNRSFATDRIVCKAHATGNSTM